MPDGSRHRTSARSDSAMRSVGRSSSEGASIGTLSRARMSPNWRLPSMRTVRNGELADRDREVEGERGLADATLGREDGDHPGEVRVVGDLRRLADLLEARDQLVAGERHGQDAVDAVAGVRRHGLLRDGEHDHRDLEAGLVDLGDQVHALDPTLEQRVHHDHVRAELADEREHARAIAHDVQQLDRGLRVEQPADVLRDLGNVLDHEEADLVRHRPDSTTQAGPQMPAPKVPWRPSGRVTRPDRPGQGIRACGPP